MKSRICQLRHVNAGVVLAMILVLIFAGAVLFSEYLRQAAMYEQQASVVAQLRPQGDSPVPAGSAAVRLFYDDEVAKTDGVYEPLAGWLVDQQRARSRWLPYRPRRVVLVMFYAGSKYEEIEALGDLPWLEQVIMCPDEEQIRKHDIRGRLEKAVGTDVELFICP